MPKSIKKNLITEDTIKLLKKFQILKDLTPDEVRLLLGTREGDYQQRIAKLVQYKPNETVIREGDFDSWVFWIVKGSFAVTKDSIFIAEFNEPGEVFGEMSSIEIDSRSATVIATSNSVCVSIDMSILDTLENITIKNKIQNGIQMLQAKRLSSTTAKLADERKNLLRQQEIIIKEEQRLMAKEKKLGAWEKELAEREKSLHSKNNRLA